MCQSRLKFFSLLRNNLSVTCHLLYCTNWLSSIGPPSRMPERLSNDAPFCWLLYDYFDLASSHQTSYVAVDFVGGFDVLSAYHPPDKTSRLQLQPIYVYVELNAVNDCGLNSLFFFIRLYSVNFSSMTKRTLALVFLS